jgi:tight adherence protein B
MSGFLILLGGILMLCAGSVLIMATGAKDRAERQQLTARLEALQPAHIADNGIPDASLALIRRLPLALQIAFARADIVPRMNHAAILAAAIATIGLLVSFLLGWIAVVVWLPIALGGCFLTLRLVAVRRMGRFNEELPTFLDSIRQMLITGNSVQQAIYKSTENATENIRRYLSPMTRRIQNGASVAESVSWLAGRLNMLELHMFATAIQTNARYGGKLSNTLSNLVSVLRDRARVIRELKAATAETRMSAVFLGILPIAAGVFIGISNPVYVKFFINTSDGNHQIIIAIILQLIGAFLIWHIMRLDY